MSLWRQITRGIRSLIHRSAVEQDISDEVGHFLKEATEAHIERGLSPEEAARMVRLELGSCTNVQEHVKSYGWENVIETFSADLRYTLRQLRSLPVFTSVIVLTIAIGVGATTAIFGAINPILFEPLPYPNADRISAIVELNNDGSHIAGTFGMYSGLVERNRSFEAIAVFKPWRPVLTGSNQPEQFNGQRVTSGYFHVLGISPIFGRDLRLDEDRLHGANVIILSFQLWQRRFGGDSAIIGRQITLDDESYVVVGVMPQSFENVLDPSADVWAPLQYDMSQGRAWGHHLRTIGRLRMGVTIDQASQEVNAIASTVLNQQHPETYGTDVKLIAHSLQAEITSGVKPALWAILGAAFLVLLIACVNVTNLLLARGVQRRGEFAMRAALGASRRRLLRQLITESLLLALLGGVVGCVFAAFGTHALVALSPADLPRMEAIGVDGAVFIFAFCMTALIGLAFGLIPALQASHYDFRQNIEKGSYRTAGQHSRVRNTLVVGEVALAIVLLVSSGLLWRSLDRLFAVDVGFESSQILTMQLQISSRRYEKLLERNRFFDQTLESVKHVTGISSVAYTSQLPLSGDLDQYGVTFEATPTRSAETYAAYRYAVSPGYMETMRIPLLRGRSIQANDRENSPFVALISESLARLRFGNVDPIGQRLRVGPLDGAPYTIIGVLKDIKQMSLAASESSAVYVPANQWPFGDRSVSVVMRTSRPQGALSALIPRIREAIWSIDKDLPITRVATMDNLLAATAAERRFLLILFEAFALAALMLAAAGIYGVLAGRVAERTREIGVRSALGASRINIVMMVLRHGLTLTGLGAAIGVIGAAILTQAIVAMLFKVSHLDPLTYLGVITLLGAVATIASCVPAWRAARVDPAITLRAE